ncbi:MAG: hypothetical protein HRT86_05560 [Ilumatobacteraceae bacterium]|nr:hypothetical protein [Ilumatobacteraceae bacterium]
MPEIKNNFLKAKMNKDLDDRLVPNGEYRNAVNLQISRSEGSDVGEFETMLGTTELAYLKLGSAFDSLTGIKTYAGKVIGQYTDEANGKLYTFSTGYTGAGVTPRDIQVFTGGGVPVIGSTFVLYDGAGNVLDPVALGVKEGMLLWGDAIDSSLNADFDPYVTQVTNANITISWDTAGSIASGLPFTIGWCNKIHVYDIRNQTTTLLVEGGFLNFSTLNRIYGVNLLETQLFWTDNRNQPRKINVDLANPNAIAHPTYYTNEDSISVCKYYPYESPKVLEQVTQTSANGETFANLVPAATHPRGYVLDMGAPVDPNIKIGDIVIGFEPRTWGGADPQQELWTVTTIGPTPTLGGGLVLSDQQLVIYNQLYDTPFNAPTPSGAYVVPLTFSRPTSTNQADPYNANYFSAEIDSPAAPATVIAGDPILVLYSRNDGDNSFPLPQVGDLVTSTSVTGPDGGFLSDGTITPGSDEDVRIAAIIAIPAPGAPVPKLAITLTKDIDYAAGTHVLNIGNNPNYRTDFSGDPELIEEVFARFSYRFKFIDNEYSLTAPFSQICFIPKQGGLFGAGQQSSVTDMDNTFKSTIVSWFENNVDTVGLKIPLPLLKGVGRTAQENIDYLIDNYKVKSIDILYKESDGTSIKVLDTINTDIITPSDTSIIPGPYNVANENIRYYYNFNYKSSEAYKTLPEAQTTRVYDKVPVKALGQEITGNRVAYGNFVQSYTPPSSIDYSITVDNKALINNIIPGGNPGPRNNYAQYPNHTLKQNRNYQVGWVLADKYGRASSVILSSNDDKDDVNGSTVYAPYKSYSDVQALTTYEWLGDIMRIQINSAATTSVADPNTGQPGTNKAYEDTSVDGLVITTAGTNYVDGTTYSTTYTGGLGSGLTVQVVCAASPGPVTGVKIVNPGSGYANGEVVTIVGGGNDATLTLTVNPPNVLGWYSYKFVVKQQEQEYYNVYFPGFTRGWPNTTIDGQATTWALNYGNEAGQTSFAILLSDNINKVPRTLTSVGPNDQLFNSDVVLYGRINNPDNTNEPGTIWNSDGEPWNCQYYPGRVGDEVNQIGLVGAQGFEIANSPFNSQAIFGDFRNGALYDGSGGPGSLVSEAQLPFKPATGTNFAGGANQAFYGVESNPLAVQINVGLEENQPNLNDRTGPDALGTYTLGALVTDEGGAAAPPTVASMRPFLSVSETEPDTSALQLFWETGDTGDIVELNRNLNDAYDGVVTSELGFNSFDEDVIPGADITPDFSFLDGSGSQITTGISVLSYTILDGNGIDVTSQFDLLPGAAPATWKFRISAGTYFWYGVDSAVQGVFNVTFQTQYINAGETYLDTITAGPLALNNLAPTITNVFSIPPAPPATICGQNWPQPGSYDTSQRVFYTFTGVNGSPAAGGNDTTELYWEITNVNFVPLIGGTVSTAVFGWQAPSPATGILEVQSGSLELGTYEISVRVKDATDAFGISGGGSLASAACTVNFIVGYAHAPKAVCAGRRPGDGISDGNTGQKSIEYYFGPNNYINNAVGAFGSGTAAVFPGAGVTTDLYYNVKNENYNPGLCLPPGWPLNYTTAGISTDEGIYMTITFEKNLTASPVNYTTAHTILVRPVGLASWQAATPIAGGTYVSPDSPGTPLSTSPGVVTQITGAAASTVTYTYHFNTPGEYAVLNKEITGSGIVLNPNDIKFFVDFGDLYYPAVGCETICSGID